MGKKSRNKGARYENEIAHLFRLLGFPDAKRHLEFQSAEAESGRDLDGTFPFAVQCKCWGKTPSITAIEQIRPDDDYPLPIAFLKRTQSKGTKSLEVVVMPTRVFIAIVQELMSLYIDDIGLDPFTADGLDNIVTKMGNSLLDARDATKEYA